MDVFVVYYYGGVGGVCWFGGRYVDVVGYW